MKRTNVILIALLATAGLTGCVERQLTLTTEPAGAMVYMADEEIGRTPLTVPFTWYGDRELIVRLDGYQTLRKHLKITPPLYDVFPLDFFSQIAPWTYRYKVAEHYELTPAELPGDEELIDRAINLREQAAATE